MGLHKFFHYSAIVSCITFHIWKSVDCYFSNKVYRDILRNSYVLTKTLKCLCTLYLKNSNLQIFIHEKLCMKLQLNDEKTCVDPWSHIDTFEGWTVLTETIVLYALLRTPENESKNRCIIICLNDFLGMNYLLLSTWVLFMLNVKRF